MALPSDPETRILDQLDDGLDRSVDGVGHHVEPRLRLASAVVPFDGYVDGDVHVDLEVLSDLQLLLVLADVGEVVVADEQPGLSFVTGGTPPLRERGVLGLEPERSGHVHGV